MTEQQQAAEWFALEHAIHTRDDRQWFDDLAARRDWLPCRYVRFVSMERMPLSEINLRVQDMMETVL